MGLIGNTAKNMGNAIGKGGLKSISKPDLPNTICRRSVSNLLDGSRNCPIVSESRNIVEGIVSRDLSKVALNTGILGLSTFSSGSSSKITASTSS